MNNPISNVYSEAFYELSNENNNLKTNKDELLSFKNILEDNPKLKVILENPNIEKEDKKELISNILVNFDPNLINLIKVLIDNQRFNQFEAITEDFVKRYNDKENIGQGIVYSARHMSREDIAEIEKSLGKKLDKKVELENILDESLIGGFTVKLDGKFIDNSIRGRLEGLRSSLKEKRGEL